jgi:putative redox protein
MQVTIKQIEGVKFLVESRSHTIVCDQPVQNGGEDAGMTPPELMLASLGSCAAFYAAQYLNTRGLATGGVEVSVTAEKLTGPARLGNFHIQVKCPIALTEDQTTGLMRSVHSCLIHNTLLSPPKVEIELTAAPAELEMSAR